ncbi:MAG: hypothetical protein P1V35_07215 [Planctomycetota bacterium]|nr:hypothetical protein [Planctomycetota bacterium]
MHLQKNYHRTSLKHSNKAGMSMVEVMIAAGIATVLLMATAATFFGNMKAVGTAKTITSGSIFLESVQENISAQPYANLLALNGNSIFDNGVQDGSAYRVDVTTFQAGVGLIQIRVALMDLQNNRELGRLVTVRSDA